MVGRVEPKCLAAGCYWKERTVRSYSAFYTYAQIKLLHTVQDRTMYVGILLHDLVLQFII